MRNLWRIVLTAALLAATALGSVSISFAEVSTPPYEGWSLGQANATSIDVSGNTLVVGYKTVDIPSFLDGFAVYDITQPDAPSMTATMSVGPGVWDLLYDPPYLYVASDSLMVYDLTTPSSPTLIESGTIASPHTLAKEGDTLYVGRWSNAELSAVDVMDPETPVNLDTISVGTGNGTCIDVSGDLVAYGTRNGGSFTLVDATDPSALVVTDAVPGDAMGVGFASGDVVGAVNGTVVTWDVSDPSDVTTLSVAAHPAGTWTMDVADGIAFAGTWSSLVSQFDVTDTSSISRLPDYMMPGRPYDLTVQGDYIYVAGADAGLVVIPREAPDATVVPESLAGATRYSTAIEASRRAFPNGADTVLIATGQNWPDALGGSGLAGVVNGPILLTPTSRLDSAVLDEIRDLGASRAIILGGVAAVSYDVELALNAELGDANVDRIAGDDRYETSELIAQAMDDEGAYFEQAFFATGRAYPDAVAVAPIASANKWPIFLVPDGGLPDSTSTKMDDVNVEWAIILGGEGAVTTAVENDLIAELGADSVDRIAGAERYSTAALIASWGVEHAAMTWNGVGIATGQSFPDALAGGVTQGSTRSVMLLTKTASLPGATASRLGTSADEIGVVRFYGGTGAVSQPVRDQILGIVQ